MHCEADTQPCTPSLHKGFELGNAEARGFTEPASSKDTLTRAPSPHTSKSSGTVLQQNDEPEKALRDRQSEECTSSASDHCQSPSGSVIQRTVLRDISNAVQNQTNIPIRCLEQSTTPRSFIECSKSSQSIFRQTCLEDAQSRPQSLMAKTMHMVEAEGLQNGDANACTPAKSVCPQAYPPEEPKGQKGQHKVSKQERGEACLASEEAADLGVREGSSGLPFEGRLSLCDTAERDSFRDPTQALLNSSSLSRACSTAGPPGSKGSPPETGGPPETDAGAPSDFPQFQRKQRSKLGKRCKQGFKHPGRLSNAEQPGSARSQSKQSGSLRKSNSTWGSDLRGATTTDDDYVPPGAFRDELLPETRSQRLSRSRTQLASQEREEDNSYLDAEKNSGLDCLFSTPSRSTRSQPQDLSTLWPCHFPEVKPAKRLRGFVLSAALGKMEEIAARDHERSSSGHQQTDQSVEDLHSLVQQSVDGRKQHRQSFAEYLRDSTPPRKFDQSSAIDRWKGSAFGRILEATPELKAHRQWEPAAEDGVSLPLQTLFNASAKPHLDAWQQILKSSADPSQSSVRKRQQRDIEQCWEDFYESQGLEQSVLSDLHEWLMPPSENCRDQKFI